VRPGIHSVTEALRRFANADLAVRVEPAGSPGLIELGESFNVMADRVVELLHAEHQRVADVAHRLRTPMTALQLELEALDRSPASDRVRWAAATLASEIDEIIRTAQEFTGCAAGRCDLTRTLAERLAFWAVLAEDDNRPWAAVGDGTPLWIPVPPAEAAAAIDALLGNVFHHTPEGTAFRAGVLGTTLVVEDDGPGIDDSVGASRRGTSSRGSTGLGLDIVQRMAAVAGGTLAISRAASGGSRIELRFPAG
jgi:signal transduction histidine kinase